MKAWLPVVSYVLVLFATIPYQPRLVYAFDGPYAKLFAPLMLTLFGIVGAALLGYAVWRHRRLRLASLGWFALAVAVSVAVNTQTEAPVEKIHLIEYGVLSVLLYRRFERHYGEGRTAVLLAVLVTGLLGVADELYQLVLPNRYFGWSDLLANFVGNLLGLLIWFGMLRPPPSSDAVSAASEALLETSQASPVGEGRR